MNSSFFKISINFGYVCYKKISSIFFKKKREREEYRRSLFLVIRLKLSLFRAENGNKRSQQEEAKEIEPQKRGVLNGHLCHHATTNEEEHQHGRDIILGPQQST